MTFPVPWVDFFSILGQFLIFSMACSIVIDMFLTVFLNKILAYRMDKKS